MPKDLQRRAAELEVRSVNRESRTIDFIASTFSIDSYGTRIDQSGWVFARNIPITWAHDDRGYTPSGGRPIGRAVNLRVENGMLRGTAEFPRRGIFQFADECFDLAADGFITSTSVAFDPLEEEMQTEGNMKVPVYRKQKLLEIAFVTIPSNEDAVLERARALNREQEAKLIRERLQNVEDMAKELAPLQEPDQEYVQKCIGYYEKKQPVNREATKAMERFYKRILKEPLPPDEIDAWKRMADAVETMEEKPAEAPAEAKPEEAPAPAPEAVATPEKAEEKPLEVEKPAEEAKELPEEPKPSEPEAPTPERKASVQIPLSVLLEFPAKLRNAYTDAAVEALQRGIPVKDALGMIDGMNAVITTSIPTRNYGDIENGGEPPR